MSYRPIKPRRYTSGKSVVARFYEQVEGGAEAIAAILRRGLSQVYGYADDSVESANMRLDQALALTEATGAPVFAQAFAVAAGGVFMPAEPSEESVAELLAKEEVEHGHLIAHIMARLDRGDPLRLDEVVAEDLDRLIAALVAVRAKRGSPVEFAA